MIKVKLPFNECNGEEGETLSSISRLLHPNEKILWRGKPVFKSFILAGYNIGLFFFGLVFIAFSLTFFFISGQALGGAPFPFNIFPLIFLFAGFAIAFGTPISSVLAHRNTEYAITNQRLIIQTGALSLKTRFIDFEKIQEVNIKIGLIDKIFGTGGIYADTASSVRGWNQFAGSGRGYNVMRPDFIALKEPYKVHKILQQAMEDLKSSTD